MSLHFYRKPIFDFLAWRGDNSKVISQLSNRIAAGLFALGLVLIGFGLMIFLLPRFFATLAMIIFFIAGAGCLIAAIKVFFIQSRFDKHEPDESQVYRKNVQIHIEEDFDA